MSWGSIMFKILSKLCYAAFYFSATVSYAESFIYATGNSDSTIASYKVLPNGDLQKLKVYNLPGIPEDYSRYDLPNNPNKFIYIAYFETNKIGVWRVNNDGSLTEVGPKGGYQTLIKPDPIGIINDKFLFVNSIYGQEIEGYSINPQTGELEHLVNYPYHTSGSGFAVDGSPDKKNVYFRYWYMNKLSSIPISANGSLGLEQNFVETGNIPFHNLIYKGYLYMLGLGNNGMSKYQIDENNQGILKPANKYAEDNLDYKFGFTPLRSNMLYKNYLYVTDASNNINQFAINDGDGTLTQVDKVNCGGVLGRSVIFANNGYAYQPIYSSNLIAEYKVDSTTGKLTLIKHFDAPMGTYHLALFNL